MTYVNCALKRRSVVFFAQLFFLSELGASLVDVPYPQQAPRPALVWSLKGFEQPKGVFYDEVDQVLYVTNVAGFPFEKDGKGWISQISTAGTWLHKKFASTVDAPKALLRDGVHLRVVDINAITQIEIPTRKWIQSEEIHGAKNLNGIALTADRRFFLSDSKRCILYMYKAGIQTELLTGRDSDCPTSVSILPDQKRLLVSTWGYTGALSKKPESPGRVYIYDIEHKRREDILDSPRGHWDGLVAFKGKWFLTDWVTGSLMVYSTSDKKVQYQIQLEPGIGQPAIFEQRHRGKRRVLLVVPNLKTNIVQAYDVSSLSGQ